MTVSPERRAALRGFFARPIGELYLGGLSIEADDVLGVLDDLDAADTLAAGLEDLLYVPHYPETYGLKPYVADGEECCDCRRMRGSGHKELCRVGRFFRAIAAAEARRVAEPARLRADAAPTVVGE